jgi:phosphoribosylanthranilate isomerase
MTIVKICGLRTLEHALAAAEAGADLIGFMFAPSRRQVEPQLAAAIGRAVRAAAASGGRPTRLVGVFVNEAPEHMLAIADLCGLDALQLSGDEPSSIQDQLPDRMLIKAVRLNGAAHELAWLHSAASPRIQYLVDAHVPGSYGGAGVLANWEGAAELAREQEVLLAGGLTPDNVDAAIRRVRPWGVDVSSGVETDGSKDVAKIRAFVAAAQAADRQLASEPTSPP